MVEAITTTDCGQISIAGASQRGQNPNYAHHTIYPIRDGIDPFSFKICYPTKELKQEIEKISNQMQNEFIFCVNANDKLRCIVSYLRNHPNVIRLVRDHLSTPVSIVEPAPNDIMFGLGRGKGCKNLLRLLHPTVHGDEDMSVGKNATIAANDLVQYARANGIKILVSTPGGFVEDSTEGSVKRVANQLKELQWREMNRLESNEARNAKYRANRKKQIKQEAEQLEALNREAMKNKDFLRRTHTIPCP